MADDTAFIIVATVFLGIAVPFCLFYAFVTANIPCEVLLSLLKDGLILWNGIEAKGTVESSERNRVAVRYTIASRVGLVTIRKSFEAEGGRSPAGGDAITVTASSTRPKCAAAMKRRELWRRVAIKLLLLPLSWIPMAVSAFFATLLAGAYLSMFSDHISVEFMQWTVFGLEVVLVAALTIQRFPTSVDSEAEVLSSSMIDEDDGGDQIVNGDECDNRPDIGVPATEMHSSAGVVYSLLSVIPFFGNKSANSSKAYSHVDKEDEEGGDIDEDTTVLTEPL